MLFLVFAIFAGWLAKQIRPTIVLAALGYGVVVGPINMMLDQRDRAWFGQSIDWSTRNVALNVASAGAWFLVIALMTFGIRKLVRREQH
jgi:hypothetical protein